MDLTDEFEIKDPPNSPMKVKLVDDGMSPLDASLRRPNMRPAPGMPNLRDLDQLTLPSVSLDARVIAALDGYDETTRGYVAPAEAAIEDFRKAVQQIIDGREASKSRDDWTEANQVLEVAALAESVHNRAARAADSALANLRKAIAGIEEMLRAPITTGGSTPFAAEIASHFRSLSDDARMKLLSESLRKGDALTMAAVLSRPAYLVGISEEMQKSFLEQFNRARHPDIAKRLGLMKAAAGKLMSAGTVFLSQVEPAMGVRWATVGGIRKKRDDAARAFKAASGSGGGGAQGTTIEPR